MLRGEAARRSSRLLSQIINQRASSTTSSSSPSPSPSPSGSTWTRLSEWWRWWTSPPSVPPARWSGAWWWHQAIVFTVFGVTGSSAVILARPVTKMVGIEGSMRDGPWSYRVGYVCVMTPLYSVMLLLNGTLAGRHYYFKHIVKRMWGHLLPISTLRRLLSRSSPPAASS